MACRRRSLFRSLHCRAGIATGLQDGLQTRQNLLRRSLWTNMQMQGLPCQVQVMHSDTGLRLRAVCLLPVGRVLVQAEALNFLLVVCPFLARMYQTPVMCIHGLPLGQICLCRI